jgi:hypothetical protein
MDNRQEGMCPFTLSIVAVSVGLSFIIKGQFSTFGKMYANWSGLCSAVAKIQVSSLAPASSNLI